MFGFGSVNQCEPPRGYERHRGFDRGNHFGQRRMRRNSWFDGGPQFHSFPPTPWGFPGDAYRGGMSYSPGYSFGYGNAYARGCYQPTLSMRIGNAVNGVQTALWGVRAIANMFGIGR
jgi:hypothetical protein